MNKQHFPYADFCSSCRKVLQEEQQIFYVEEATGNYFCSEDCIRKFYDPVAAYYQTMHNSQRSAHDISQQEFDSYKKYEPLCLQNPDEIWVDETKSGEIIYFLHAKFTNEAGAFYYVVMCYCLEKQPTFILLSFPTRDERLLAQYRVGQKLDEINEIVEESVEPETEPVLIEQGIGNRAISVEEEMFKHRKKEDISKSEFDDYSYLLEETIQNPDEAWEMSDDEGNTSLHLISQFEDNLFYIVLCILEKLSDTGDNWRVLYYFPTKDNTLVAHYRRGELRESPIIKPALIH